MTGRTLNVGAAEIDITPPMGMALSGDVCRYRPVDTVLDPIHARALVADTELVLLDEPAAGLDRSETDWLATKLREIIDFGIGVLLVDHDMGLVLSVCDRIHVIDFGKTIAVDTPQEIRDNPAVIAAYLGSTGGQE